MREMDGENVVTAIAKSVYVVQFGPEAAPYLIRSIARKKRNVYRLVEIFSSVAEQTWPQLIRKPF
jgi:hypothetical protein